MITKREAAIISAYTGYLLGDFGEVQLLGDELLGRPTWTHEYGSTAFGDRIRELSRPLFLALDVEGERHRHDPA